MGEKEGRTTLWEACAPREKVGGKRSEDDDISLGVDKFSVILIVREYFFHSHCGRNPRLRAGVPTPT